MRNNWPYSKYSKVDLEVKNNFPFADPRENQLETISEIKNAIAKGYKYIILEAGTGTGKSAIAATLASIFDSTYILTVTKQLQEQYLKDFKDLGFKLVKGRGNFKCKKYLEDGISQNCDEGRCIVEGYRCEYSIKEKYGEDITFDGTCYYDYQKYLGLVSDVVISNYAYLFLELNYVQDFTKRKLMIFDEAHNLEESIMNQLKLELDRNELKEYIGVNLSKQTVKELNNGDYKVWISFIEKIQEKYYNEYKKIKNIKNKPELAFKINYLKKRIDDCRIFIDHIRHDPDIWIFDYDSYWGVAEFKPIKVDKYAKSTFLNYGDICIFMSATILDYRLFSEWLGLKENEVYAIRQKSPFAIDRNPIKTFKGFNMSYKNLSSSAPKTIRTINEILDNHKTDKGIIHTISYGCKNFLKKKVNSDRFIDHKTHNRAGQLMKFKDSEKPVVLISPSMNEGVDLPGDLCRFQIIYKIPYPNVSDKQTSKRMKIDSKWFKYKTSLSLVQTLGRGMRYEDDYCMTYFIDSRLKGFVLNDELTNNFLPETFRKAIDIAPAKIDYSKPKVQVKREVLTKNVKSNTLFDKIMSVKPSNDTFKLEIKSDYRDRVKLKLDLINRGKSLIEKEKYAEAIQFYKGLLEDELFANDYHPYLKLSQVYELNGNHEQEVKIISQFFKSGIYCRKSKIKFFKKKLVKLYKRGYLDYSKIDQLEEEFNLTGAFNKNSSNIPVPIAYYILKSEKNRNKKPNLFDPEDFKEIISNESYDDALKFKVDLIRLGDKLMGIKEYDRVISFYYSLLDNDLFINDYYLYRKLAIACRKNHRYDEEVFLIVKFFESGIYCDSEQLEWFKKRLKTTSNYGSFDYSTISQLEEKFRNRGAYNKSKMDLPVMSAKKIKKAKNLESVRKPRVKFSQDSSLNDNQIMIEKSDEYSRKYFNGLANEITKIPGYVSDRNLLKHDRDEFISIEMEYYDKINKKANLKNEAKKLEKEDELKAIEFYNDLKKNKLFANDYYPYRRQCILFKNIIKNDWKDLDTVIEIFESDLYLNKYQLIWLENKIHELTNKLNVDDSKKSKIYELIKEYKENEDKFKNCQNNALPIAERIFKDEKGLKLLSKEKYNLLQDIFYVKELGVGYIRRREYDKAIHYFIDLLGSEFLYFRYHAYKQLGRIFDEMDDSNKFKRLYENYLK